MEDDFMLIEILAVECPQCAKGHLICGRTYIRDLSYVVRLLLAILAGACNIKKQLPYLNGTRGVDLGGTQRLFQHEWM